MTKIFFLFSVVKNKMFEEYEKKTAKVRKSRKEC